MKILLTFFVLLFSSSAIAETYACSLELSRWNRVGEVETKTYKRVGEKYVGEFKNGNYDGQGTLTYASGRVVRGIWKNDELVEPN